MINGLPCIAFESLQWRHIGRDSISNHQHHDCLLKRLFRRRSKKTSKLRVTGLCVGKSPGPGTSPHKGPVTRKMLPLDDVIMWRIYLRFPQYHVIEYPNSTENHEKLKYYNDLVSTITRDITRYNRITLLWRELMEPSGQSTRLIGCLSMHDDVSKWKHFPRNWPFVRSQVNSPHKGQWCGALMFSLICVWINGWENNRETGDLRRYCVYYDVTVMGFCTNTDSRMEGISVGANDLCHALL